MTRSSQVPPSQGTTRPDAPAGFKERLQRAREHAGLTQNQLADKVGVHQKHLSRVANGQRLPRKPLLMRLAAALDVDPAWLEHGIVNPTTSGQPAESGAARLSHSSLGSSTGPMAAAVSTPSMVLSRVHMLLSELAADGAGETELAIARRLLLSDDLVPLVLGKATEAASDEERQRAVKALGKGVIAARQTARGQPQTVFKGSDQAVFPSGRGQAEQKTRKRKKKPGSSG